MRMHESRIAGRMMAALMLVTPSLVLADDLPGAQPSDKPAGKQPGAEGNKGEGANAYGSFKLPEGAKVLGEASINEVRLAPEFGSGSKTTNIERVVGVVAMDRVYQAKGGYKKVVSFFDDEFKKMGIEPSIRATTPVSTAWAARLPEGGQTHIVVRNTQPVS